MDMPQPLPGVTSQMIQTPRLAMHVLRSGPPDGIPVIFMHGNFSSALYWEETLLALPAGFQGIAPDLRGYGWTEDLLVDASRGVADWADDMVSLLDTLNLAKAHFVGWSLGAGVLYGVMSAYPDRVLSATLVCPVPTYGFAGTKDADGDALLRRLCRNRGRAGQPGFRQAHHGG